MIEVKVDVQLRVKKETLIKDGEFFFLLFISIACFRVVEIFADFNYRFLFWCHLLALLKRLCH